MFACKATEWLTIQEFETTALCLLGLCNTHSPIRAPDLSQQAACLTKVALLSPNSDNLAIYFATEDVGCMGEYLHACDLQV